MNEHLKLQIGKRGTAKYTIIVDGARETEYVQGTLKSVEGDIVVIRQYIPYSQYLLGNKPESIDRTFKTNEIDFSDTWR